MSNLTFNEMAVLSILIDSKKYGLEIIEAARNAEITLFLGTLYNLMSRLEKKGFVKSEWGNSEGERGGNRRKYFKITAKGESALLAKRMGVNFIHTNLQSIRT